MKVAIVHDWLTLTGGAERVLEELFQLYPQSDLFCVVCYLPKEEQSLLGGRKPKTTFIQQLPFAKSSYRRYLPLMPIAVEQFDLSEYDLIISSTHAVAKGVITGPDQIHIAYTHSPMRYAWDMQHVYLKEAKLSRGPLSAIARLVLHYMRLWDSRTTNGVDRFIANSEFIARRIHKTYGREAAIVYPPVDLNRFRLEKQKENFYLTASRMVPYKRIPLIVEAFSSMPDRRLVVIGDGPDMDLVRSVAAPNVELLGRQSDEILADHMARAKAFVFAAKEDFGIVPLEAQACGTPVVAFGRGGSLETIQGYDKPGQTGVFFNEQNAAAIVEAILHLDHRLPLIRAEDCRDNANRFSTVAFQRNFLAEVDKVLAEHQKSMQFGPRSRISKAQQVT